MTACKIKSIDSLWNVWFFPTRLYGLFCMMCRCASDDDLSQLPADPSNFPSYPRPLRSQNIGGGGGSLYGDSTVVIRRQRNLTRELQPPMDPIYGSRSITSFKEEALYGTRTPGGVESIKEEETFDGRGSEMDDLVAQAQNTANSQQYGGNSGGGSTGYHTASNSSGSSSPVPPPSATPGLATPPPPMAPLYPNHNPYGHTGRMSGSPHHSIYGQTAAPAHPIYGQTSMHHNIYGRSGQSKLPQAPQIPLPPIPQGSIPTNLRYGAKSDLINDDGQFPPPPPLSSPSPLSPPPGDLYPSSSLAGSRFVGGGAGGSSGNRAIAVGRSSSLRFAPGTPPRHFTNSLPHVMPRNSHYNTGV